MQTVRLLNINRTTKISNFNLLEINIRFVSKPNSQIIEALRIISVGVRQEIHGSILINCTKGSECPGNSSPKFDNVTSIR